MYQLYRDFNLVKKGPKNSGMGKPPPPFRAMPERKRAFTYEVFPYPPSPPTANIICEQPLIPNVMMTAVMNMMVSHLETIPYPFLTLLAKTF